MGSGETKALSIAVLVYPGADILDYAGPIEVLSHLYRTKRAIETDIKLVGKAAKEPVDTGHNSLAVSPTTDFSTAFQGLEAFDVLIVPGGPPDIVDGVVKADGNEIELIRKFEALPPPAEGKKERVLLSVCTGALLLGAAGVLGGLPCTTHHLALTKLEYIIEARGAKSHVENGKRWVDAGVVKPGLRIMTAGGVSSGLDATLKLVQVLADKDSATFIADLIEYDRKQV